MLRVKEEEMSARERRDGSYHRRRRYSDDYDSEVELYQQYKAAGLNNNMVNEKHDNLIILPLHNDATLNLIDVCPVSDPGVEQRR